MLGEPEDKERGKRGGLYEEVLEKALWVFEVHVDSTSGIGCLLEKDGVTSEFTNVDGDFL
jgi:hypothetical protein